MNRLNDLDYLRLNKLQAFFYNLKLFICAIPGWFWGLLCSIGRFFKNMWHEMKKVSWPGKKEILNYSLVVFAFMVIMGVIIGLIDFGSGALIDLIVNF